MGPVPALANGLDHPTGGVQRALPAEDRHQQALPYYRRLLTEYPDGRYAERAAWRVGWGDLTQKRPGEAVGIFEAAARKWPRGSWTPGYLYWAGRARREAGQEDAGLVLLEETVRRYKHLYHGFQARLTLRRVVEGASTTHPAPPEGPDVPEPLSRLLQKMMARRPEDRFQGYDSLLTALEVLPLLGAGVPRLSMLMMM